MMKKNVVARIGVHKEVDANSDFIVENVNSGSLYAWWLKNKFNEYAEMYEDDPLGLVNLYMELTGGLAAENNEMSMRVEYTTNKRIRKISNKTGLTMKVIYAMISYIGYIEFIGKKEGVRHE